MSNAQLAQDQNGRTVDEVFAQVGDARSINLIGGGSVRVRLTPGALYELSSDGELGWLMNDGAVPVTPFNGRLLPLLMIWMGPRLYIRATPERPWLWLIQAGLIWAQTATLCEIG